MQFYFTFFEPILKWLEKPEAVISLSIVFIIIRLIYVKYRSKKIVAAEQKGKKDWRLEVIDIMIIAMILVFGIVWNFMLKTYYIPSSSMVPTLYVTDRLIANRFIYNFHPPRRGDVVVFTPPKEAIIFNNEFFGLRQWLIDSDGTAGALDKDEMAAIAEHLIELSRGSMKIDPKNVTQTQLANALPVPVFKDEYIKRVIAVAGDRVKIVPGYYDNGKAGVYVNDIKQPLAEKNNGLYENNHKINGYSPSHIELPKRMPVVKRPLLSEVDGNAADYYEDMKIWISVNYLYEKAIRPLVKNNEIVIPKDCIFVMGDNRSDGSDGSGGSFDGRYWGVVPLKSVKARAVAVFFPFKDMKSL